MSPAALWRCSDARRIPGVHPLLDGPGVGCELGLPATADRAALLDEAVGRIVSVWTALSFGDAQSLRIRPHFGGASIGARAPADRLGTAVDALKAALAEGPVDIDALRQAAADEAHPALADLLAQSAGLPVFFDDDGFTAGMGRYAQTWPLSHLPDAATVAATARRIPCALITGTNGKTTTTRMVAAIARAAGHGVGNTSSDGVVVNGEWVEKGDWTGPGAARTVLRHPEVEVAVLETARGGLLRRGLAFAAADVAAVTNVSADHLGEWGLHDLHDMAWAKLGIAAGVRSGGTLVLHGRDPYLSGAAISRADLRVLRFADGPEAADLSAWATNGHLYLRQNDEVIALMQEADIPLTLGGAARFMVENALCAALVATSMGLPLSAVRAGLSNLRADTTHSLGRMNAYRMPNGARVVVDFAHNSAGVRALQSVAAAARPGKVVSLASQAGDRTDALIALYADALAGMQPDVVILKELPDHLRGRQMGEVPEMLRRLLRERGMDDAAILEIPDELDASRHALTLIGSGDLALLLVHEQLDEVLAMLAEEGAQPEGHPGRS